MKKLILSMLSLFSFSTCYASADLPPPAQCSDYYQSQWVGSPMGIQDDFYIVISSPTNQEDPNASISGHFYYYGGRFGGMSNGNCVQNSDGTVTFNFHNTAGPVVSVTLNSIIGTHDVFNISGYAANQINLYSSLAGQVRRTNNYYR